MGFHKQEKAYGYKRRQHAPPAGGRKRFSSWKYFVISDGLLISVRYMVGDNQAAPRTARAACGQKLWFVNWGFVISNG